MTDWGAFFFEELEKSDAIEDLKKTDVWPDIEKEIQSILRGDWNISDFRTAEMGAAWMLAYIVGKMKGNDNQINFTKDKRHIAVCILDEVYIDLDLKKTILEDMSLMAGDDNDNSYAIELIQEFRTLLDEIEQEVTSK